MALNNILVTNDDGITARGIHILAEALSGIAKVYVCAPDRQRTAAGHGITVSEKLFLKETPFPGAQRAYSCSGTPADCVKLGLGVLHAQGLEIDMVCSGINHGANLGTDVLYSGTVSAALEGSICGIPSIAFSCCSHEAVHMEAFSALAPHVCQTVFGKLDPKTVLNVNVPDLPPEELRGLRFTTLGARKYENSFTSADDLERGAYYEYSGAPLACGDPQGNTDVAAFEQNYITITPLQYDLTSYDLVGQVSQWGIRF